LLSSQQLVLELRLKALVCVMKIGDGDGVGTTMKLDYYSMWKSRMKNLLFCKGLYDPKVLTNEKMREIGGR